ncbi:MAG: energy-coupling factor transporter transmembrane protein EcfT [Propionibacteriaceae bacterium]|nr:energy-coupling factor transporter transmembrane protein EcfT [Propionibacteriaceae bacterium]
MTSVVKRFFMPRSLHPGAWWGWAIGCAVVASRTVNPILLGLLIAICCVTVQVRRTSAPWAMAFRMYLYLACFIIVLRVGFRVLFSAAGPTVVLRLPVVTIPGLPSVRLLGPVSAEALVGAGGSALQLAAMVVAVGAANALANPKRLLAAVPGALYEWGAVVVIAISVFPQLAESLVRVGRARQLRAETGKGAHLIRNVAMPVLSDALDRSLILAGAMDSRGYGRSAPVSPATRRATSALLILGSLAVCVGAYGLLDTGVTPVWAGASMVAVGVVVAVAGLKLSGARAHRTRYRPDPMAAPEWVVLGSGILACVGMVVVSIAQPLVAYPPTQPLGVPPVSVGALLAVLVLLVPAALAPSPQRWPSGSVTVTADHAPDRQPLTLRGAPR